MSNSEVLLVADPAAKLDTGMKVSEAVQRTRAWWEETGRALMVRHADGSQTFAKSVFSSPDPDDENYLPSGIINGLEWDLLTKREKLRLIKFWHHFFVRMQDIIGADKHLYEYGQGATIE